MGWEMEKESSSRTWVKLVCVRACVRACLFW
jgi:hypothetical protein